MNRTRMFQSKLSQALLVAVIGSVAIVGCKKKEEAVVAPAPTIAEPVAAPMPAPAATASVVSVDLGTAAGPDRKLAATTMSFMGPPPVAALISETVTKSWTRRAGTGAPPLQENDLSENETALP